MSGKKDLNQSLMQTSSQSNDPYFLCRDDLATRLKKLQASFENWEVLLRNENTETSASFKKAHAELNKRLRGSKKMLNELTHSVNYVKQNRSNFPHITQEEFETRQAFVTSSKAAISKVQNALRGKAALGKMEKDKREVLAATGGSGKVKAVSIAGATTEEYVHNGRAHQKQVLEAQDRDMEEIEIALDGIHEAGTDIYNELDDQTKMIDDLNKDVEKTQNAMDKVNENLGKLLATKDGCQIGIVIAMSVVCVISVILLITVFV